MIELYYYKAINLEGKVIKGKSDLNTLESLNSKLIYSGFYLIKYKKFLSIKNKLQLKKVSTKDLYIFLKSLKTLVSSGITISYAITILSKNCSNKHIKQSLLKIKENILQGKSLSSSMREYGFIYPNFLLEMISVSEECGNLPIVLDRMTKFYGKMYKIKNKISKALVYPFMVFVVSTILIFFLINNILPEFAKILTDSSLKIPSFSKFILNISAVLKEHKFIIIGSFIMLSVTIYKYFKSDKGSFKLSKLKLKVPLIKKIYLNVYSYKICMALGIMLKCGININCSMEKLGDIIKNKVLLRKIYNSKLSIQQGQSVTKSFKDNYLFNKEFISMINIGEESGNLDDMFITLAKVCEENVYGNLNSKIKLIEPTIIILISIVIFVMILSIIFPMLDIVDSYSYLKGGRIV